MDAPLDALRRGRAVHVHLVLGVHTLRHLLRLEGGEQDDAVVLAEPARSAVVQLIQEVVDALLYAAACALRVVALLVTNLWL